MPRSKLLDSQLSTEDRQWLRDLQDHRGFQLLVQAATELLQQDLGVLVSSAKLPELLRAQGAYNRGMKILALPKDLQQVNPTLSSGGQP